MQKQNKILSCPVDSQAGAESLEFFLTNQLKSWNLEARLSMAILCQV